MNETTIEMLAAEQKLSAPLRVTVKKEISYSKSAIPCVVPVGEQLDVYFSEASPAWIYFEFKGRVRPFGIYQGTRAFDTFSRFTKPPGLKTMEHWMDDGVAKSVTGARVEPDGRGPDGSPSWLLVLNLI